MASYIKQFFDFLGNEVFPKTREKAVYDDNNVRLDNKLVEMNSKYTMSPVIVSNQSQLDSAINSVSNIDRQWYRLAVHVNTELSLHGGVWYIEGFRHSSGYEWQDATTYYVGGKSKSTRAKIDGTWTGWANMISSYDIVQSDTVSDANKVPSSVVTNVLGQEIDTINNNLAYVDYSNSYSLIGYNNTTLGRINIKKQGVRVRVSMSLTFNGTKNQYERIDVFKFTNPILPQATFTGVGVSNNGSGGVWIPFTFVLLSDGTFQITPPNATNNTFIVDAEWLTG